MKHKTSKVIMGVTFSVAAIAAAIDHTSHRLPEVESEASGGQQDFFKGGTPCGLGIAPCSLGEDGERLGN